MGGYGTRDALRARLIEAFACRGEVYRIALFGKEVTGSADSYSDIDVVVCSHDLRETYDTRREIVGAISPVIGTLLLASATDCFAEMLMLADYSPYQKVDFSIADRLDTQAAFGPFLDVYHDGSGRASSNTASPVTAKRRDVPHETSEMLFSIPRFTKCLHRADVDMYRRWKGGTNDALVLLYEKHFGWERERTRRELKPHEARDLYAQLSRREAGLLDVVFPRNGRLDLALSFRTCVTWCLDLAAEKAAHFDVAMNAVLCDRMRAFVEEETAPFTQAM